MNITTTARIPASRPLLAILAIVLALCAAILTPAPAHGATAYNPNALLTVGDSWNEGVGDAVTSNGLGWTPPLAKTLGMTFTQDGKGGSGYENPTAYGPNTFESRVYNHPTDGYGVVIFQGSTNDKKYVTKDPATGKWRTGDYAGHVNVTLRAARNRYPSAIRVVVGPTAVNGAPDATTIALNDVLRRYAAADDAVFIDAIGERWFVPGDWGRYHDEATGHPNDAAYQVIAGHIASHVAALR